MKPSASSTCQQHSYNQATDFAILIGNKNLILQFHGITYEFAKNIPKKKGQEKDELTEAMIGG
jgi:hypothetical protein